MTFSLNSVSAPGSHWLLSILRDFSLVRKKHRQERLAPCSAAGNPKTLLEVQLSHCVWCQRAFGCKTQPELICSYVSFLFITVRVSIDMFAAKTVMSFIDPALGVT